MSVGSPAAGKGASGQRDAHSWMWLPLSDHTGQVCTSVCLPAWVSLEHCSRSRWHSTSCLLVTERSPHTALPAVHHYFLGHMGKPNSSGARRLPTSVYRGLWDQYRQNGEEPGRVWFGVFQVFWIWSSQQQKTGICTISKILFSVHCENIHFLFIFEGLFDWNQTHYFIQTPNLNFYIYLLQKGKQFSEASHVIISTGCRLHCFPCSFF